MNIKEKARRTVHSAVKNGSIIKPTVCELCGDDSSVGRGPDFLGLYSPVEIVAHHWRGYDYPLDIWWICKSCNRKLIGESCHSGTLDKAQAIKLIKSLEWHKIESEYRKSHIYGIVIPDRVVIDDGGLGATRAMRAAFGETD